MSNTTYFGGNAKLAGQLESTFRTAPGTPAGQLLKFDSLKIGRNVDLQDNNTIAGQLLPFKRDEMDSAIQGSGTHILDLNDIGWWLTLLLGQSTTTGSGPYTHTFTLSFNPRPSATLELAMANASTSRYLDFLGMMLSEIEWDVLDKNQSFKTTLIGAVQSPFPATSTPLYSAPASLWATLRACSKGGAIYDVSGSSTLGAITKGNVKISNDLQPQKLADGQEGYGQILLGTPMITGSLAAIFDDSTLMDAALSGTSKPLVLVSKNAAGNRSLTLNLPHVEFDRPQYEVKDRKAIIAEGINYRAHYLSGDAAPTIVLVNDVATYV